MIRAFILAGALALTGTPATAQQTDSTDSSESSWYDYFAGYAGSAIGLVFGSGETAGNASGAGTAGDGQTSGGTADALNRMIGSLNTDQIQSLAGAAYGILGGGTGSTDGQGQAGQNAGAGLPSLSALQGTLASLLGGGTEGQNLAQVLSAVATLSPDQRTAILDGLTTHIPGLLDKAQQWWSGLSETDRQGYIQQIKDALTFVMGQVGGSPTP